MEENLSNKNLEQRYYHCLEKIYSNSKLTLNSLLSSDIDSYLDLSKKRKELFANFESLKFVVNANTLDLGNRQLEIVENIRGLDDEILRLASNFVEKRQSGIAKINNYNLAINKFKS